MVHAKADYWKKFEPLNFKQLSPTLREGHYIENV